MENEVNQLQDENVFSDVTEEEENLFTEESEDTPVEEEKTEEKVEENPFALKVTYNGEEQTLNQEDARNYAQKGMNYDKIYEPLQRLARLNGLNSVSEYLNMLDDTQINYEISKEMESLRNDPKYENVSDEVLEEIATSRVHESIGKRDREYEQLRQGQADAEEQRLQKEIEMFFREYPEFRDKGPDSVDPKVYEYVKEGYTLLEAYNKWQKEQPEVKISKQNEENKKRSVGSTTNAGKVEADDFLKGFLNG